MNSLASVSACCRAHWQTKSQDWMKYCWLYCRTVNIVCLFQVLCVMTLLIPSEVAIDGSRYQLMAPHSRSSLGNEPESELVK
jgi:hypothetical protein